MVIAGSGGAAGQSSTCTVWREPQLILVRLSGEIDDKASQEWRDRLTAEMARGAPRFVAFDMHDANPRNSMSTRFQVAAFARDMVKRVEWVVLLMPSNVGAGVVVRLIMSIVAAAHVSAVTSRAAFQEALESMRRGERPKT